MPTVVTSTIAATSSPTTPDYSTLQAWEDDLPADLVSDDEQHIGECLDQGEFTSASTLLTVAGHTTDATRNIILRCASGASFKDKAGVRTTALFYNASNGVAARVTGAYAYGIYVDDPYFDIEGLQLKHDSTSYQIVFYERSNAQNGNVRYTLLQVGSWIGVTLASGCSLTNSLVAQTTGSNPAVIADGNINAYATTIVRTGSTGGVGCASAYGTFVLKNCVTMNFTTTWRVDGGGAYTGSSYCATDAGSLTGSNHLTSLTYADQFESTTNDFRVKTGADLIGAGIEDLTNYPEDISGFTRSDPPTIGCWEYDAGGGGVSVTPGVVNLTLTGFAPTVSTPQTITIPKVDLTTTSFAPTVSTPRLVTVPKIDLATSLFAPTVSTPQTITVPKVDLVTTSFAPTVTTPVSISVPKIDLTTSLFAPTVSTPQTITVPVVNLSLSTFAPTITADGNQVITPGVVNLTLTTFAPDVGYDQTIDVPAASLTLTGLAPTVSTPILVTPGVVNLTTAGFAPVITAGQNVTVTPSTLALTLTGYAPTILGTDPILTYADFEYTAPHMLLDFTPYEGLLDYTAP